MVLNNNVLVNLAALLSFVLITFFLWRALWDKFRPKTRLEYDISKIKHFHKYLLDTNTSLENDILSGTFDIAEALEVFDKITRNSLFAMVTPGATIPLYSFKRAKEVDKEGLVHLVGYLYGLLREYAPEYKTIGMQELSLLHTDIRKTFQHVRLN